MTVLNINGRRVTVDDSFKSLSPEEQNATVEEISRSLGSQEQPESQVSRGARNELSALTQGAANSGGGVLRSIDSTVRGAADTLTFGLSDELSAAGGALTGIGGEFGDYSRNLRRERIAQDQRDMADPVSSTVGRLAGGVAGGVGLARNGLSLTTAAANRGAGLLGTSAASAAEGAILGGAQGFGSGEGGFEERLASAGDAAKVGAAIGGVAPAVVSGVTTAVRRAITPLSTSPERQALVDTLRREGVETTAGQSTGSRGLRYAEGEIGGQAAEDMIERQGEQFTAAALRRAGINANRATPEVIDDAFTRIGAQFDDLAARNTIIPDRQLQNDIVDSWREYMSLTPPNARVPVVGETVHDIVDTVRNTGRLDGAAYQSARSRLDRAARNTKDPELANALRGLRSSLDDAMERSIAQANPNDLGAWREARNQYRNMLVIEQAATGAGEGAAQGLISPSQLRSATVTKQGRRNYARGRGDFAELARAGEGVMKALPQSGTAPRIRAQNIGAGVTSILGAGGGASVAGPAGAVAGAAAGAAIPMIVGRMMMSPAGQAYLRNTLASGNISPQTRAAIVAAINNVTGGQTPRVLGQEARQPLEITVTPRSP
ncbi:hypothetical protein ACMFL9_12035 (plasmid) [Sinorhizobium meliloti]